MLEVTDEENAEYTFEKTPHFSAIVVWNAFCDVMNSVPSATHDDQLIELAREIRAMPDGPIHLRRNR